MKKNGLNTPSISGQAGFTMIEISIGLVVTGLLIAGVLRGGEFINSAKQKALINQIQSLKSAVTLSSENPRVTGLLGDGAFIPSGEFVSVDGNKDGIIDQAESLQATKWLRNLRLIDGNENSTHVQNPFGGQTFLRSFYTDNSGAVEVCATNIPTSVLIELDKKLDGISGQMLWFGNFRGAPTPANATQDDVDAIAAQILAGTYSAPDPSTNENTPGFFCMSI
ncbi:type II secretion system protein [Methylomicrobium lacus]|uniref:type II secretion system protein n=1 Tax=Methylomicrobium lacus TaxID=136992 RepID=UPI00045E849B|nr:prepilin-type N-terminal cleavage/methylation domain-containing protein [Methylomicrobium lacus]